MSKTSLGGRFSLAFTSSQLLSSQEKHTGSLDTVLVLGAGNGRSSLDSSTDSHCAFGVTIACPLCSSSANKDNSTSVKTRTSRVFRTDTLNHTRHPVVSRAVEV